MPVDFNEFSVDPDNIMTIPVYFVYVIVFTISGFILWHISDNSRKRKNNVIGPFESVFKWTLFVTSLVAYVLTTIFWADRFNFDTLSYVHFTMFSLSFVYVFSFQFPTKKVKLKEGIFDTNGNVIMKKGEEVYSSSLFWPISIIVNIVRATFYITPGFIVTGISLSQRADVSGGLLLFVTVTVSILQILTFKYGNFFSTVRYANDKDGVKYVIAKNMVDGKMVDIASVLEHQSILGEYGGNLFYNGIYEIISPLSLVMYTLTVYLYLFSNEIQAVGYTAVTTGLPWIIAEYQGKVGAFTHMNIVFTFFVTLFIFLFSLADNKDYGYLLIEETYNASTIHEWTRYVFLTYTVCLLWADMSILKTNRNSAEIVKLSKM